MLVLSCGRARFARRRAVRTHLQNLSADPSWQDVVIINCMSDSNVKVRDILPLAGLVGYRALGPAESGMASFSWPTRINI